MPGIVTSDPRHPRQPAGRGYNDGMSTTSLANHFLIAMPALEDPNFQRSVTLICQHDADGAMGIVINRVADYTLGELLAQMELVAAEALAALPLVAGGPVQPDRGFVLHDDPRQWNSTLRFGDGLAVTTSRDILTAMASGDGPGNVLIALGYAGWTAGQLEAELAENSWLTVPADRDILFHRPLDQRWQAAASSAGVDLARLAGYAGHA
jgi:putative transcriptional regulator